MKLDGWLVLGLVAQTAFFARFLVQWIVSERAGRSIVPIEFWYLSLVGGILLLTYAIHRVDPVFILGQSVGLLVYSRNLWLISRGHPSAIPAGDAEDAG